MLRIYGGFRFSKMASVRHLGFVDRLLGPPKKSTYLEVSTTVQNLVGIDAAVSIIRHPEVRGGPF